MNKRAGRAAASAATRGADVRIAFRRATLDEIYRLRFAVLRPGQPPQRVYFPGDDAPGTQHFGAFIADRNICCLTLLASELAGRPAWQLRGMATHPDYQRQGIGARLLTTMEEALHPRPGLLWCNARAPAVGFYQCHGWHIISPQFMIQDVGPHFQMRKELP